MKFPPQNSCNITTTNIPLLRTSVVCLVSRSSRLTSIFCEVLVANSWLHPSPHQTPTVPSSCVIKSTCRELLPFQWTCKTQRHLVVGDDTSKQIGFSSYILDLFVFLSIKRWRESLQPHDSFPKIKVFDKVQLRFAGVWTESYETISHHSHQIIFHFEEDGGETFLV